MLSRILTGWLTGDLLGWHSKKLQKNVISVSVIFLGLIKAWTVWPGSVVYDFIQSVAGSVTANRKRAGSGNETSFERTDSTCQMLYITNKVQFLQEQTSHRIFVEVLTFSAGV